VARKSKIETEKKTDPAGLDPVARATDGIVESKPKRKAAPRKKRVAPKKKPDAASKPTDRKKASRSATTSEPSDEEIRMRAYFIAERRLQLSLQGDSAHDWIEAKRQLMEEAKRSAS
jgi:hypothetical protein